MNAPTSLTPVLIALGANLGDRAENLNRAVHELTACGALTDLRASRWWETQPVGYTEQPAFLNGVLFGRTTLSAPTLLAVLQKVEKALGKATPFRNGPRQLDLDIIFFGSTEIREGDLQLPHPRWAERGFVVRPALSLLESTPPPENFPTEWATAIRRAAKILQTTDPDWSIMHPHGPDMSQQ